MEITELQKIGVGLVGFGIFFLLFGMLLYMDAVLLAFGNILFLSGLAVIIGLRRTFGFFFQKPKLKGTSFFLGGIVIVLLRWPVLGMLLEIYGFINLFRSFFPIAFGFLGSLINIPFLSKPMVKHMLQIFEAVRKPANHFSRYNSERSTFSKNSNSSRIPITL